NVRLTTILALKHSNFYWQTVNVAIRSSQKNATSYVDVHLLNAYLDDRGGPQRTVVRLLGASRWPKSIAGSAKVNAYSCLLWFEGDRAPILSPVVEVYTFHQPD